MPAREFGIPTIITRLNTPYGNNGGWPYYHLLMIKNGTPDPRPHGQALAVHAASTRTTSTAPWPASSKPRPCPPASSTGAARNTSRSRSGAAYIGELIGIEPKFDYTEKTLESVMTDNTKMRELVGPAKVTWKDGIRRMVEDRHPDWIVKK